MRLVSVNTGKAEREAKDDWASPLTGLYKKPQAQSVFIADTGLQGDVICDKRHHGGFDQAVYVYGDLDYAWWSKQINRSLYPGCFGENLTISDYSCINTQIGDHFIIGSVVLEVTAPRIPCDKFARHMEIEGFKNLFRRAERPGAYCRVLSPGDVKCGDEVILQTKSSNGLSLLELFRDFFTPNHDKNTIQHILEAPVAERVRKEKLSLLKTMN